VWYFLLSLLNGVANKLFLFKKSINRDLQALGCQDKEQVIAAQEQDWESQRMSCNLNSFSSLNKCYHDSNHLLKVNVFIRLSCVVRSLSIVFVPMNTAPQRPRCTRHNVHGPWVVDGINFHWCFILNNVNITSTLSDLPILLVSTVLLDSSQLVDHVV